MCAIIEKSMKKKTLFLTSISILTLLAMTGLSGCGCGSPSAPGGGGSAFGTTWNTRLSGGEIFYSIARKGAQAFYVAVGSNGGLYYFNGRAWIKAANANSTLKSVFWDGAQFVAAGYGTIMTSADGMSWVSRSVAATAYFNGVTLFNGTYYAYGSSGSIYSSADGITWTAVTSNLPAAFNISSIYWVASLGKFVAVGTSSGISGAIYYSADGMTWTAAAVPANGGLNAVIYANATTGFIAVGKGGVMYSSLDGITWTALNSGTTSSLNVIAFNGNLFSAAGAGGTFIYSTNGTAWTAATQNLAYGNDIWDLALDGTGFMACGSGEAYLTSPDGAAWTAMTASKYPYSISSVAWSGSQFVALGNNGKDSLTSSDGLTWVVHGNINANPMNDLIFANGQFVAVGSGAMTSADGVTWAYWPSGPMNKITWSGTQYAALGGTSVATSPDGHVWTNQISNLGGLNGGLGLSALAYGNGRYVAVQNDFGASTSYFVYSADAATWTQGVPTSVGGGLIADGAWNGRRFVFAGYVSPAVSSPDGINWTTSPGTGTDYVNKVIWAGNQFFIACDKGIIHSSTDGANWNRIDTGITENLQAMAYSPSLNRLVIVGNNGTILATP